MGHEVPSKSFRFLCVGLFLLLQVGTAQAGQAVFENNRHDLYVPNGCREARLSYFQSDDIEYFTFGIRGALKKGFTHEYPIEREDARFLWNVFLKGQEQDRNVQRKISENPELQRDFSHLDENRDPMDFNFHAEGEVLELLAIVDLYDRINSEDNEYFITGGIEYSDSNDGRTIGELDLLIGYRETCEIIAVGESKLGLRNLRKAKEQLARFRHFLMSHDPNSVLNQLFGLRKPTF